MSQDELRRRIADLLRTSAHADASVATVHTDRAQEGIEQAITEVMCLIEKRDARRRNLDTRRLSRQRARARQAEEHLESALAQTHVGSWVWSAGSDRIVASRTMLDLLGMPHGGPALTGARLLDIVQADDRSAHWRHRADEPRAPGEWQSHQYRLVRPADGRLVWLEERTVPMAAGANRYRLSGLTWDITTRIRAEEAVRDAGRRQDRFLATLAHELRNPLAPIVQAAAVALLSDPAPAAVREKLEVISRQGRRMSALLDDLLDVSCIANGRLALRRQRVEAAEVLRTAVETAMPQIAGGGHPLKVRAPDGPAVIDADPLRLSQSVANLLINAARYSAPGRPIDVMLRRGKSMAEFVVSDQGIGIPPDELERVFEMFGHGATPGTTGRGGLGVGLALARELVQLHGGRLEARSDGPGRGASFHLCMPLARPETGSDGDDPAASAPREAFDPVRVLVVDDNADAADSLALLLRMWGLEVSVAYGGDQALTVAVTFAPQVVLLDLGMPGMDGFETARRLRRACATGPPTLVAVSGWGQPADRQRSADAGFDFHLTKPVDEQALGRILAQVQGPSPPDHGHEN